MKLHVRPHSWSPQRMILLLSSHPNGKEYRKPADGPSGDTAGAEPLWPLLAGYLWV